MLKIWIRKTKMLKHCLKLLKIWNRNKQEAQQMFNSDEKLNFEKLLQFWKFWSLEKYEAQKKNA